MGKWTPDHYDTVLRDKMRTLVSGAVKRTRLEKTEPCISYEAFVEELDIGDSFTTSIIEILVKELAERRLRQNATDRGLIANRTAISLKRLSNPTTIYGAHSSWRPAIGRRGYDLSEYLSAPPPDQDEMDEDEEDFAASYDPIAGVVEGGRVNPELYEAYGTQPHSWSILPESYPLRRSHFSNVPSAGNAAIERTLPPIQDSSSSRNNSLWHFNINAHPLARQPSLRRPSRLPSRISDFNEFSSRRRSTTRQNAQESGSLRSETAAPFLSHAEIALSSRAPTEEPATSVPARRFFPFGSGGRRYESLAPGTPPAPWTDDMVPLPFPLPPSLANVSRDTSEERQSAPRLRRGGVRAPESMLSRHASPSPSIADSIAPPFATFTSHPPLVTETEPTISEQPVDPLPVSSGMD